MYQLVSLCKQKPTDSGDLRINAMFYKIKSRMRRTSPDGLSSSSGIKADTPDGDADETDERPAFREKARVWRSWPQDRSTCGHRAADPRPRWHQKEHSGERPGRVRQ